MLFEMNPTVKKVNVNTPPRQPVLGLLYIDEFVSGPWAKQSVESAGKTYWWQASLNYCGDNNCPFRVSYCLHSCLYLACLFHKIESYGQSRKGR